MVLVLSGSMFSRRLGDQSLGARQIAAGHKDADAPCQLPLRLLPARVVDYRRELLDELTRVRVVHMEPAPSADAAHLGRP